MSEQKKSELFSGLGLDGMLESMKAFDGKGIQPFAGFSEDSFKSLAEMNAEGYRFVVRRMEEAMRLLGDIAKCKSPAEIFEMQTAFVNRMIDDWMQQASKVMAMASSGDVGSEPTSTPEETESTPGKDQ